MNKQEFITLLEKRLFELPQVEKEHLLNYYNETIEDRIEDGMSEAEAVASLDSVEDIVKPNARPDSSASTVSVAVSTIGW